MKISCIRGLNDFFKLESCFKIAKKDDETNIKYSMRIKHRKNTSLSNLNLHPFIAQIYRLITVTRRKNI